MRIVVTGSSGRIGRAIMAELCSLHDVTGIDRIAGPATRLVADLCDVDAYRAVLDGADAVIHTAGVHAPHIDRVPAEEFHRVNVAGTDRLARAARAAGVKRLVFTSTTAVFGGASAGEPAHWITEASAPNPRSIYHRTKLDAEALLAGMASTDFAVRILRMSRCFPEPADVMAGYRLHRGIDARDVARAHGQAALLDSCAPFDCFIISAATPFEEDDLPVLGSDARDLLALRLPALVKAFEARGWSLPRRIDRVYVPRKAQALLGWRSLYGFDAVIEAFDHGSSDVLPPCSMPSCEQASC